ncbi:MULTISPECIES: cell envelope integrity protein TolA [unclassified Mesorhizobium]|uniref:cell envelope integrity protein TolA n=1 Tax=unclassified Mesorhizobium TaxID=325217 RepID=UPI00115E6270|nr:MULTISPECIES: cell envelope integrity protein TolA [unclassified Mesorhizobium]TRD02930.1 cell envelope integrity protein TolA [Mesorhizobium sp. WSM4305]
MPFPVLTMRGLRGSPRHRPFHGLVFVWSLAGALMSGCGSSRADVAVTRDIHDYLMKAIQTCWAVPANATSVARVRISLNKDGSLAGPPKILDPVTPQPDKVAKAAVRAIKRCAPFPGLTSYAAHYDLWREVVLTFHPAQDTSGGRPAVGVNDIDKLLDKYKNAK